MKTLHQLLMKKNYRELNESIKNVEKQKKQHRKE